MVVLGIGTYRFSGQYFWIFFIYFLIIVEELTSLITILDFIDEIYDLFISTQKSSYFLKKKFLTSRKLGRDKNPKDIFDHLHPIFSKVQKSLRGMFKFNISIKFSNTKTPRVFFTTCIHFSKPKNRAVYFSISITFSNPKNPLEDDFNYNFPFFHLIWNKEVLWNFQWF